MRVYNPTSSWYNLDSHIEQHFFSGLSRYSLCGTEWLGGRGPWNMQMPVCERCYMLLAKSFFTDELRNARNPASSTTLPTHEQETDLPTTPPVVDSRRNPK